MGRATTVRTLISTRRWLAALLALALLLTTLATAPPAGAATCTVTSAADGGNGTLRAALSRTGNFVGQGCETITFAAGVANIALASYLTIDRAVTIQGPGTGALTVRYAGGFSNLGAVFYIKSGPATLRGLTIAGGRANGGVFGAGLSVASPVGQSPLSLTLDGVRVVDNQTSTGAGGGLYASNATLTVANSVFEGNSAAGGGGPRQGGGGIFLDDGFGFVSATLTNTVVAGNTATTSGGGIGIVSTYGRGASLTVRGGSFVGLATRPNTSLGWGGGIYASNADMALEDSASVGNGSDFGGGIFATGGTVTLYNGTVANNTTTHAGGGIYAVGVRSVIVTNSTINGNNANGGCGGGICAVSSTLAVANSTISGNVSAIQGGGIHAYSTQGANPATLTATTVVGNRAAEGGGIYAGGSVRLQQTIVAGNTANGAASDCAIPASFTDWGYNLVGAGGGCPTTAPGTYILGGGALATAINPTLASNGGPTLTHNPVPGGPAVNRIPAGTCARATDQRGVARPQGGLCDIGAVEYRP